MKKLINFFCFALISALAMGFVACGDDDDEPKGDDLVEKLQGTWTFESMKLNVMGQIIEMDLDDIKNNSGYDQFYDQTLTFSGQKVNGQPYTVKGNKILLPYYEDEEWWMDVTFKGSKMTLYMDIDYQGVAMKAWVTYTKSGRSSYSAYDDYNSVPLLSTLPRLLTDLN